MCTVREIQEAIREHCQSQHDMESTEIDQVMQRLPFDTSAGRFFPAPCAEAAVFLAQPETIAPDRRSLFERLRLFSCHELREE